MNNIDADVLRDRLDAHDHRHILQKLGFEIARHDEKQLSGIRGPSELGEGQSGNFSIDLQEGLVNDFGNPGYGGNLFQVVQDVLGLSFPEALQWIVDELNLDASTLKQKTTRGENHSSPTSDTDDSARSQLDPEPVVSDDQVRRWHERLLGDSDAARSARRYLSNERGIGNEILDAARIGLAKQEEIPDDWSAWYEDWWIIFPVPRRDLNETPIVFVKGVAFDPASSDWKRTEEGDKIARNAGPAALWDLVPADDSDEPQIDGPVIVCEGEVDALCALSHHLNAVTGTAGAMTFKRQWAEYIADLTPASKHGVVIAYDGDEDGEEGSRKAAEMVKAEGVDVRIAELPAEKDVNDVLTESGSERFRELIHSAEEYEGADRNPKRPEKNRQDQSMELEGPHGFEWRPPLSLVGVETPPQIPVEVYPDWLSDFVESVAESVQVAPDLPALLVLSILAGALQKKGEVRAKRGWTEPLTLWTATALASGERKSPTYEKVARPIEEYESKRREEEEDAHLHAKDRQEILQKRLRKAKKRAAEASEEDAEEAEAAVRKARDKLEAHEVPPLPQLWIDDTTSEALLQLLNKHYGRMLTMSPEGDLFKFMASRHGPDESVLNVYKKAWTGNESVRDNRVTREGSDVSNPALSVGICVQPQVLEDLAEKRTFRGEGIIARFLYAVPEPKAGYRKTGRDVPPLDTTAQARYDKKIEKLLELDPKSEEDGEYIPYTLRLEEEARPVLWDFEEEIESALRPEGPLDGLKDWGNKLVGQTLRIAGLLHVAETGDLNTRISADAMRRAIRIGRALIPHARVAYGLLNANEKVRLSRYVLRRICENLDVTPVPDIPRITSIDELPSKLDGSGITGDSDAPGPISKRDLWQLTKGKSEINEVSDLDEPLSQLEEHNLIRVDDRESPGPGRNPSPNIYLNPILRAF